MKHTQVLCQGVKVDELLAPLFDIIWNLGIKTLYSCQGVDKDIDGYISFASAHDAIFFLDLIGDNYNMIRMVYDDKGTKVNVTKEELIFKQGEPHLRCVVNFFPEMIGSMMTILNSYEVQLSCTQSYDAKFELVRTMQCGI